MKAIVKDNEIEFVTEGRDDISALARFVPPARVEVVSIGMELQPENVGRMSFRAVTADNDPILQEIRFLSPVELQARILADAERIKTMEERLSATVCYWCGEPVDRKGGSDHWRRCGRHPARNLLLDVYHMLDSADDSLEVMMKIEKELDRPPL